MMCHVNRKSSALSNCPIVWHGPTEPRALYTAIAGNTSENASQRDTTIVDPSNGNLYVNADIF